MYLDFKVDIPVVKGKITYRDKAGTEYVYYEYDRIYHQNTQKTNPKRVTIGKRDKNNPLKMIPNENFVKSNQNPALFGSLFPALFGS